MSARLNALLSAPLLNLTTNRRWALHAREEQEEAERKGSSKYISSHIFYDLYRLLLLSALPARHRADGRR